MTHAAATQVDLLVLLERDLARGTSDLPALPRSVTEALRLARTPSVDFDEVAQVAAGDPPLAARVVSVANSALYARSGMPKIASVRRAAVRLGAQATRDVLYQVAYASMFVDAKRFRELIESTFEHGVRAGRGARLVAREIGLDVDLAFLAGLLHDIGRARCWKILAKTKHDIDMEAASAAVDVLHAAAGAELAATWHLPDEVVDACRWHHEPMDHPIIRVVAAADALARHEEDRASVDEVIATLREAGVPAGRAPELVTPAAE